MKISFEAQMRGAEDVGRILKDWEQRLNATGVAGDKMTQHLSEGLKAISGGLSQLSQVQGGMGGFGEVTRGLGELGKSLEKNLGLTQKLMVDSLAKGIEALAQKIKDAGAAAENAAKRLETAKTTGDKQGEAIAGAELAQASMEAAAAAKEKRTQEWNKFMHSPLPGFNRLTPTALGTGVKLVGTGLAGAVQLAEAVREGVNVYAAATVESPLKALMTQRERTVQYAEAAKQGDITRPMLDQANIGYLNDYLASRNTAETAKSKMNVGWGFAKSIGHVAADIGGDVLMAGGLLTAATTGWTGIGAGVGIGMMGGGYALKRFGGGEYKGLEELSEAEKTRLAAMDEQLNGFVARSAGKFELTRANALEGYQRSFGRKRANDAYTPFVEKWAWPLEMRAQGGQALGQMGKLPTENDLDYLLSQKSLGVSGEYQLQGARYSTRNAQGTQGWQGATREMILSSGMGGADAYGAREEWSKQISELLAPYFAKSAPDVKDIGAFFLAANAQAMSTGKVAPAEATKGAAEMGKGAQESLRNPMSAFGIQTDMWLMSRGIVDPRAQALFKTEGMQREETMKDVIARAKYGGDTSKVTPEELAAWQKSYGQSLQAPLNQIRDIMGTKGLSPAAAAKQTEFNRTGSLERANFAEQIEMSGLDLIQATTPDSRQALTDKANANRAKRGLGALSTDKLYEGLDIDQANKTVTAQAVNDQRKINEGIEQQKGLQISQDLDKLGNNVINAILSGFTTIAAQLEKERKTNLPVITEQKLMAANLTNFNMVTGTPLNPEFASVVAENRKKVLKSFGP